MDLSHSQLAYEIAITQLRSQKDDLRNARNQAGMAAAMSGLVATVFAGMLQPTDFLQNSEVNWMSIPLEFWLVILTFFASLYFAAMVSITQRTCYFEMQPKWVLERDKTSETVEATYKQLALDCDDFFDQNEVVILEARNNLWWSVVFGCAQIPAWLLVVF